MKTGSSKLLVTVSLLYGCSALSADLFNSSESRSNLHHLWSVEWFVPLVQPRFLEYSPREPASPASDEARGAVIVGTRDGFVRSISIEDGSVRWEFQSQGPLNAAGLVANNVFYIGGSNGVFYALDAASGALLWKFEAGEELTTQPIVFEGRVLFGGASDTLFVLDAKTGAWAWQYKRELPSGFSIRGASRPLVVGQAVYRGFADGHVVSLNFKDGTENWVKNLALAGSKFKDVDSAGVWLSGGNLVFASYSSGVSAMNPNTGDVLWSTTMAGLTSIAANNERLWGVGDNEIASFSSENGRLLWTAPLNGAAGVGPWLDKKFIAVSSGKAVLFFDPSSGKLLSQWNPGRGVSSAPIRVGNRLFLLSNIGTLFSLRLEDLSP